MKRISSIVTCIIVLIMFTSCLSSQDDGNETEASDYMGIELTPISEQGNNAIKGTRFIDKDTYRLRIDGTVERPKNLTYEQIIAYTPISKVVKLNCVEGWGFTAKWTGIPVKTLLHETGIKENTTTVIYTVPMAIPHPMI